MLQDLTNGDLPVPMDELTTKRSGGILLDHGHYPCPQGTNWNKWISKLYEQGCKQRLLQAHVVNRLATKVLKDISKMVVELGANPQKQKEVQDQTHLQLLCGQQSIEPRLQSLALEGSVEDGTCPRPYWRESISLKALPSHSPSKKLQRFKDSFRESSQPGGRK
jgi:hypothetical protein